MPPNADNFTVLKFFSGQNKETWKSIASQEAETDDPSKKLLWQNGSGLAFFPYYDADDIRAVEYLDKFRLPVAEDGFAGNRKWLNTPVVTVETEKKSNTIALEHLANGADAIHFHIKLSVDFKKLLSSIEWQYCSLFFTGDARYMEPLSRLLSNEGNIKNLHGALFWEDIPKKSDVDFYLERTPHIHSLGINVPRKNSVEQIAEALASAVAQIEQFKQHYSLDRLIRAIAFAVPCHQHFFDTVAKLKALRQLWFQVTQAYGVTMKYSEPHIHAISDVWVNDKFQPHGNMLKGTTTAMASILGGCDSLTVVPENEGHSTMARIARNTSSILREESHLDKVSDPLAGAFGVDVITDTIAREAWRLFQTKMNA